MHRVHIDTSLVPLRRKDRAEKKWEDCIGMQLPILKDNIPTGEYVTIEDYILEVE